jgi:hypothetical protein
MKQIVLKDVVFTQTPSTFKDEKTNKDITYNKYTLYLNGFEILVKPVNGESKVRLSDAFAQVK